jgi:hypothetical protein
MTRKGKVARLPRAVRDELNRRLQDGETAVALVLWLNNLPEVRHVLAAHFETRPINEQNLCEWKAGGYVEWQTRQDAFSESGELAADAQELLAVTDGRLTDHLATVLAARYAVLLRSWPGDVNDEIRGQFKMLHGLCAHIVELRRSDQSGNRLALERERQEQFRTKTEEEVFAQFQRWAENPAVRDALCQDWLSPEEKTRRMREMFGLPPPPGANETPESAMAPEPENQGKSNQIKPNQTKSNLKTADER